MKIISIILSFLLVSAVFGIASVFGAIFNVDSMDFQFQSFNTSNGYIFDAKSKDDSLSDAYDDAFFLYIDGNLYSFPSGDYTTEAGGMEYVLGSATISGLTVSRKIYFPDDRNWVRYLEILHNPTRYSITVDVNISSSLGSDGGTRVVTTSSGDTIANKNDYWTVSDDYYMDKDRKFDPSLTFVIDGPNGNERIDYLGPLSNNNDRINYTWEDVTIAPGQTVVLMHFGGLAMNNDDAIAIAQGLYSYNDPKMEYDLGEKKLVINWYPSNVVSKTASIEKILPIDKILKIVKGNQEED